MQAIPETVRRVLRSWLATEVLTPQVTRNGWRGVAAEAETTRVTQGSVIGACAVLDEWGVLAPATLAIASFAGGRMESQSAGVFAAAAETLQTRSARDWLRLDQMAPAQ